MTLEEFADKAFSISLNKTIYVFTDEDSADAFAENDMANCIIFMTIKSQLRLRAYANERILKAKVQQFYAFDKDVFGVVVEDVY